MRKVVLCSSFMPSSTGGNSFGNERENSIHNKIEVHPICESATCEANSYERAPQKSPQKQEVSTGELEHQPNRSHSHQQFQKPARFAIETRSGARVPECSRLSSCKRKPSQRPSATHCAAILKRFLTRPPVEAFARNAD